MTENDIEDLQLDESIDDATEDNTWNNLPDVVLVKIYAFLPEETRCAMASTCKRWAAFFKSPGLWRTQSYQFGTRYNASAVEKKCFGFAKHCGGYLWNLSITCEYPTHKVCRRFQKTFTKFVWLLCGKCQLRKLSLPGMEIDRYWRHGYIRDKLLASLCQFLRTQHHLKHFDMSWAQLPLHAGLRILADVGRGSGRRVEYLALEDFFHLHLALFTVSKYHRMMAYFRNISELYLNYNCISNELLTLITKNNRRKLRLLNIKVMSTVAYHINHLKYFSMFI